MSFLGEEGATIALDALSLPFFTLLGEAEDAFRVGRTGSEIDGRGTICLLLHEIAVDTFH